MIRLTVCMFGLAGFATVLLLLAVRAPTAEAAPAYCGHAYKTYVKSLPSGATEERPWREGMAKYNTDAP